MHYYKLVGPDNKTYLSEEKGTFGGHRKLKIYGRLDCPSALRHIKAGHYVKYRVFFSDEETALAAGYRPCSVCMNEHYRLWKEGKLMKHALRVTPILDSQNICSVHLADGTERCLTTEKLNCPDIAEKLRGGIEHCHIQIDDDFCVIVLSDENMQWGYTAVWNYVENEIVHLVQTPFAVSAIVYESQVIVMYLVQYWGHPADLWYSIKPLSKVDLEYEPDRIRLDIPVNDSVKGPDSCRITLQHGKVVIRAGDQEKTIKISADAIK